jgi:hypothetical protein
VIWRRDLGWLTLENGPTEFHGLIRQVANRWRCIDTKVGPRVSVKKIPKFDALCDRQSYCSMEKVGG